MWSTHFQALLNCCLLALDLAKALYFKDLFLSFYLGIPFEYINIIAGLERMSSLVKINFK